jgi:hypothetical protein
VIHVYSPCGIVYGKTHAVHQLIQHLPSSLLEEAWAEKAYENDDDAAALAIRELSGYKSLCDFGVYYLQWTVATKHLSNTDQRAITNVQVNRHLWEHIDIVLSINTDTGGTIGTISLSTIDFRLVDMETNRRRYHYTNIWFGY